MSALSSIRSTDVPTKRVRCYHCGFECAVSVHAMSSSCSHCNRQLAIADVVVRSRHWGTRLQTCGRVVLESHADVRVNQLTAGAGVEIHGTLHGNVVSFGPVTLGGSARVTGDIKAPSIDVAPGATILDGSFSIAPNH